MRHHPHDKRHKALLEAAYESWADVHVEHEVTSYRQSIDLIVRHTLDSIQDTGLPLLQRMSTQGTCLFEIFYNTPGISDLDPCIRKQLTYHHDQTLRAGRSQNPRPDKPHLWILSSGRPESILSHYEARPMNGWPRGFWQTRAIDAIHIVVINNLPSIRDTLFLRLLGRGPTLRQALDEFHALPTDSVEHRHAAHVLLAFEDTLPQDSSRKEEPVSPLQEVRQMFAQKQEDARMEGMQQGKQEFLIGLLEERFVELPARFARKVERADGPQLEVWGKRVLSAQAIEEIFA